MFPPIAKAHIIVFSKTMICQRDAPIEPKFSQVLQRFPDNLPIKLFLLYANKDYYLVYRTYRETENRDCFNTGPKI